jgi:hypothetical protein
MAGWLAVKCVRSWVAEEGVEVLKVCVKDVAAFRRLERVSVVISYLGIGFGVRFRGKVRSRREVRKGRLGRALGVRGKKGE